MLQLEHRFVQYIPEALEPGIIYISMEYATAAHGCCCGCGEQVITPFSPTDWKLTFDGETVSLWPSIGNWNFPCRSHYIIRDGRVRWAKPWSDEEIEFGRSRDRRRKEEYFDEKNKVVEPPTVAADKSEPEQLGFLERFKRKSRKRD